MEGRYLFDGDEKRETDIRPQRNTFLQATLIAIEQSSKSPPTSSCTLSPAIVHTPSL